MLIIVHHLKYIKNFTLFTSCKSRITANRKKSSLYFNVNFGKKVVRSGKKIIFISQTVFSSYNIRQNVLIFHFYLNFKFKGDLPREKMQRKVQKS